MPRRPRMNWAAVDKGALCGIKRCNSPIAQDRLCLEHYSSWVRAGRLPVDPIAMGASIVRRESPIETKLGRERDLIAASAAFASRAPLLSPEQAAHAKRVLAGIQGKRAELEKERLDQIKPHVEHISTLFDPVLRAAVQAEQTLTERLRQFSISSGGLDPSLPVFVPVKELEPEPEAEVRRPTSSGFPAPMRSERSGPSRAPASARAGVRRGRLPPKKKR